MLYKVTALIEIETAILEISEIADAVVIFDNPNIEVLLVVEV